MSDRAAIITDNNLRSTGEILRDVVCDVQELLHSEMRLAKAEVAEQVGRAKSAGGMMGGAAAAGLLAAMCFITVCIGLLALAMPVWAAALIMTFLLGVAAVLMFTRGRTIMRDFHALPQQTIETLKEDVEWAKQRTR